jgi:hypothetical protein
LLRVLAAAVVLAGCGGRSAPAGPAPEAAILADDPLAAWGGLESTLTGARKVEITATAESFGAFRAHLTGIYDIERERRVTITYEGELDGTEVAASWRSDKPFASGESDVQSPVWADGVLIGLTRMGVLHNLARLTASQDPDTGNGDVRTWVEVDRIRWKDGAPRTRTLVFEIVVAGVPAGEAELVLDERGLPLRREQVVHFEGGDMRVVEHYDRFVVAP